MSRTVMLFLWSMWHLGLFAAWQLWWTRRHARNLDRALERERAIYDHYWPTHPHGVHPKDLQDDCPVCAKERQ